MAPATVAELLRAAERSVETALAEMPATFLEARRLVTRELGLDPTPEQLQTLMRLAHDSTLSGSLGRLAVRFVRLRAVAEDRLRQLFGRRRLAGREITAIAETIPQLVEVARSCELELREICSRTAVDASPEQVDFLLQVGASMRIAASELLAGVVLAPRLALFADARDADALREVVPGLSESETLLVTAGLSEADASAGGPSRVAADALALRTLLQQDLDGLDGGLPAEESLGRLRRARAIYEVVVERLRRQQDAAVAAGLVEASEELRRIGRTLYAEELRLTQVLGASGAAASVDVRDPAVFAEALDDLRRADRPQRPETTESDEEKERRGRVRRVLGGTALALACLSLTVHVVRAVSGREEVDRRLVRLAPSLPVTDAVAAGSILIAEVAAWEALRQDERLSRADEIGRRAAEHGFEAAVIVDGRGIEIARWSPSEGAALSGQKSRSRSTRAKRRTSG